MTRLFSTAVCTLLLSLQAVGQSWPYWTYKTAPFQPPKLEITKSGETVPGSIFIGPRDNQPAGTAALIYDEDGNLVYQSPQEVTANFRVQKLFGRDVITFWAGEMMEIGFGYGTVHILDDTYKEIYTVKLTGNFVSPTGEAKDSYIDLHESTITPRNTLLVTAYNVTQANLRSIGGAEDGWILDGQFYEIDIRTNEVLYSWSALDHPDELPFTDSKQGLADSGTAQERGWDAYHINAVEPVNEGYIISIRHYWSGYYINNDGTVRWQLSGEDGGDFKQGEGCGFTWQHDIRVFNETEEGLVLTMFNNANTPTSSQGPSTGLRLGVDLANMAVSNLQTLNDPNDETHSVSQGSYQLLDNSAASHGFVNYGSITKVKEFDAAGNVLLTARFGPDNQVASYRGYKQEWHATPFWKPAVVVSETAPNTVEVAMSWNGATDYDNWAIYGGNAEEAANKTFITTVPRTGFETVKTLENLKGKYIQVVAQQGSSSLGYSDIIGV